MKNLNTPIILLFAVLLLTACETMHQEKEFSLGEMGLTITLPGNSTVNYSPPSHAEDAPRCDVYYNDGNSQHSSVAVYFEKIKTTASFSLEDLKKTIEEKGGKVLEEYTYSNGFIGCSYELDGNKLYRFVGQKTISETYIIEPNEIYNNKHRYLSVMLKAVESIEVESMS